MTLKLMVGWGMGIKLGRGNCPVVRGGDGGVDCRVGMEWEKWIWERNEGLHGFRVAKLHSVFLRCLSMLGVQLPIPTTRGCCFNMEPQKLEMGTKVQGVSVWFLAHKESTKQSIENNKVKNQTSILQQWEDWGKRFHIMNCCEFPFPC